MDTVSPRHLSPLSCSSPPPPAPSSEAAGEATTPVPPRLQNSWSTQGTMSQRQPRAAPFGQVTVGQFTPTHRPRQGGRGGVRPPGRGCLGTHTQEGSSETSVTRCTQRSGREEATPLPSRPPPPSPTPPPRPLCAGASGRDGKVGQGWRNKPFPAPLPRLFQASRSLFGRLLPPRKQGLNSREHSGRVPGVTLHLSPHHWRSEQVPSLQRAESRLFSNSRPTSSEPSPPWLGPVSNWNPDRHKRLRKSDDLDKRLDNLAGLGGGGARAAGAGPEWGSPLLCCLGESACSGRRCMDTRGFQLKSRDR